MSQTQKPNNSFPRSGEDVPTNSSLPRSGKEEDEQQLPDETNRDGGEDDELEKTRTFFILKPNPTPFILDARPLNKNYSPTFFGGTFALYSLLCRYANVGLIPKQHPEDQLLRNYSFRTPTNTMRVSEKIKEKIEGNRGAKIWLFQATIMRTSMFIGDGVLTPCISVLSAVSGFKKLSQDDFVPISIAILIALFMVQRFGTFINNSVNIYIGIGVPWPINTIENYLAYMEPLRIENASGLSFSLIIFFAKSVALGFIRVTLGAELGGPKIWAWITCIYFMCLWLIFVRSLSSLRVSSII